MGLFRKDLYRAFLVGFLIGTAGLAASMGGDARAQIVAQMAHAIPGADLVVLPDAAHIANVAQPMAFAAAVRQHLEATAR